jgi:wyosine [tRNA(Phe)-imidazoG37] synthetase (radical SAM superfamily)
MVAVSVFVHGIEQRESDAGEIFRRRHAVEHDGLVAGQPGEKVGDPGVSLPDQKRVVPRFDDVAHGDGLDLGKIHHHAVMRLAGGLDHITSQRDLDGVAMAVQVTALALVVGNAVAGVELEAAGDLHGKDGNLGMAQYIVATIPMPPISGRLTVQDHSRDSSGMTYVYPVVSRRAGGVSVGINLNPNNACNWRCIYCQVPNLTRSGPPPIDLARLADELAHMLAMLYEGDYLERHVPVASRRVVDIAFSGNGEPTSAVEFPAAVAKVGEVIDQFRLASPPPLRLITNGSLLGREAVQKGIALIGRRGGETWFKIDAVGAEAMRRINGAALQPETVLQRLRKCSGLCPTWVQTCFFALDGKPPTPDEFDAYLALLERGKEGLAGVHLYGLARPSLRPEAARLTALPVHWLESHAARIHDETGLTVCVSP